MVASRMLVLISLLWFVFMLPGSAFTAKIPDLRQEYPTTEQVFARCEEIAREYRHVTHVVLGRSAGGAEIPLLEIDAGEGQGPSVLLVANVSGSHPIATLAAIEYAEMIAEGSEHGLEGVNWLILPLLNVDAYHEWRSETPALLGRNARPLDEDLDGRIDEDGPQDINSDGHITFMRWRDPQGQHRSVDGTPLMTGDGDLPAAGERYSLAREGVDFDGDGRYGEDGAGGVELAAQFPHDFPHKDLTHGPWPVSESEVRDLMELAFARDNIAMILVLDRGNNLLTPPFDEEVEKPSYRPGGRVANRLGLEAGQRYDMEELLRAARLAGYSEMSERRMLRWLDEPAPASPDWRDARTWQELATSYRAHADSTGLELDRVTHSHRPGSIESWGYYQYGVPTVALDLLSPAVPQPDTTDGALERPEGVEEWEWALWRQRPEAFQAWTPFQHPQLGEVEIGGLNPALAVTPPIESAREAVALHEGFLDTLVAFLPKLHLADISVERLGPALLRVEARVENRGRWAYPTWMGRRTQRPAPAVLELRGGELLEGMRREVLEVIPGGGSSPTIRWLVKKNAGQELVLRLACPVIGGGEVVHQLEEGVR